MLVVVRGTDDVSRMTKLLLVLVPVSKKNLFSGLAAAQKGVKIIIVKDGSSLDPGAFSVQLTRLDNMDHLDLIFFFFFFFFFWVHGCEPGRVSDGSRPALCQTLSIECRSFIFL